MIKVGRLTKKEIKEVEGIFCRACRKDATHYISVGWEGDGQSIDFCERHFKQVQQQIAKVKL